MVGVKPTLELDWFDNYSVQIMIPLNTKSGKPDLNIIYEKYQDKDKSILNNSLSGKNVTKLMI